MGTGARGAVVSNEHRTTPAATAARLAMRSTLSQSGCDRKPPGFSGACPVPEGASMTPRPQGRCDSPHALSTSAGAVGLVAETHRDEHDERDEHAGDEPVNLEGIPAIIHPSDVAVPATIEAIAPSRVPRFQ